MMWKPYLQRVRALVIAASVVLLILGTLNNLHVNETPSRVSVPRRLNGEHDPHGPCPLLPEDLGLIGQIPVNVSAPRWEALPAMYPDLEPGGRWRPRDCVARSRVAVVVPYRNREYNLRAFLQHMHGFLQRQKLDYGIIVAEQAGQGKFNRGLMRNVGFREANMDGEYDCTVFNDVDLLPENDLNSYGCSDVPKHMCVAINYFDYKPIASGAVFGGAVSFRNDHFLRVNGYSNLYFGWGGEDDDIMTRVRRTGVGFYRARPQYGRYTGIPHAKDHKNRSPYKLWRYREGRAENDGLNSLRYTVLKRERRKLYTWVLVQLDEEAYQKEATTYMEYMDSLNKNKTSTKKPKQKSKQ